MPKSRKKAKTAAKQAPASSTTTSASTKASTASRAEDQPSKQPTKPSKQSRVIEMLKSRRGATIDTMMKATGWQQHSVRGFLAGVVRKRLKLKLESCLVDGQRMYRIAGSTSIKPDRSAKPR
jgi:hypothetical protein